MARTLRSMEHTLGAAKQWHRADAIALVALSLPSLLASPRFTTSSISFSAAAIMSASPERTSIVRIAATPAPMLCPVNTKPNPGFWASAAAAGPICFLTTCHALATIPACAHPPKNGTLVEHASVSRSPPVTVPLTATTTLLYVLSTATYDAGENARVHQSAETMSFASMPALRAAASVAFLSTASPSPDVNAALTAPTNPCALSCMLLFWSIAASDPYAAAACRPEICSGFRFGNGSRCSCGYSSATARFRAAAALRCSRQSMIPATGSNVAAPSRPSGFISFSSSVMIRCMAL